MFQATVNMGVFLKLFHVIAKPGKDGKNHIKLQCYFTSTDKGETLNEMFKIKSGDVSINNISDQESDLVSGTSGSRK